MNRLFMECFGRVRLEVFFAHSGNAQSVWVCLSVFFPACLSDFLPVHARERERVREREINNYQNENHDEKISTSIALL